MVEEPGEFLVPTPLLVERVF